LLLESYPLTSKLAFTQMLLFFKKREKMVLRVASRKTVNDLNGAKKNKLVMELLVRFVHYEV